MIRGCELDGKKGYQASVGGQRGVCHTYPEGDETAQSGALRAANHDRVAMQRGAATAS